MINKLTVATTVSAKTLRTVNFLFAAVRASWAVLFVGLVASLGLVIAKMAYGPAATVAGCLFVAGFVGFAGSLAAILALSTPSFWALCRAGRQHG